jgi:predicted MFS family arabinose efflux permease
MGKGRYKNYLLVLLLIIFAFNFVDRVVLGLVLQDIKNDLHLSDTQLGFLTGIAFALFYSVMGIPIARWADHGNRVTIISITAAIWSVGVALCGAVGSFLQLLLVRIGVAVGEAGCVPPAHSLIADYFTRAERPRAVAIYMLGAPLSAIIGYFLAGWLNEYYGWRLTFMMMGLPGFALAALAWLTLREPRRERPATEHLNAAAPPPQASLKEVLATLQANATFRHLLLCFSVTYFFGAGTSQWLPTFFIRSYEMQTGELGSWFAAILGLGGILGTYLGGEWASRRAARNERLQLQAMSLVLPCIGVLWACIYLAPNRELAFASMALAALGSTMASGPMFATIQTLVPERMRAVAISIIYLFANLIGMGLGPLAAGALSDAFRPWAGDESVRYASLTLCSGYLWAAWHLWRASRTVERDLAGVEPEYST